MFKLKLFHVTEKKTYHARPTFEIIFREFREKFAIWFIFCVYRWYLIQQRYYYPNVSSYIQFDCEGSSLSDIGWFLTYVEFYLGSHFPSWALASHQSGKVNQFKSSWQQLVSNKKTLKFFSLIFVLFQRNKVKILVVYLHFWKKVW